MVRPQSRTPFLVSPLQKTKSQIYIFNPIFYQAHSSVEKAANIAFVKRHILPTDDEFALRGQTLREAVEVRLECKNLPVEK